jgi:hypothetical protein
LFLKMTRRSKYKFNEDKFVFEFSKKADMIISLEIVIYLRKTLLALSMGMLPDESQR